MKSLLIVDHDSCRGSRGRVAPTVRVDARGAGPTSIWLSVFLIRLCRSGRGRTQVFSEPQLKLTFAVEKELHVMSSSPIKTFKGSCHCGLINYSMKVVLSSPPVASRCNCTICQKTGFTGLALGSIEDFELETPKSLSDLADYQLASNSTIHRYSCPKCGVHVFRIGSYEYEGNVTNFQSVNVLTLDQPQEGLELSEWKIEYVDGRADNWMAGKKDKPWPGGLI